MRALILGCLAWLFTPLLLHAQPETPPPAYADAVKRLDAFIARQVEDKQLPALSIALVLDQKILWARGYGHADRERKKPATADTVYRVGSVSKLFTDLAVMQLVERGALDLDDPVTKHLRDFKPINRFDKPITLRQLMAHRSGLVREPPLGNYFDPDTLSLEKTVQSLNRTELVLEPGTKTKYSNAGIAVVGFVLEQTQKQSFPRYLQRSLLAPLGMKNSSFEPELAITRNLAQAAMWTYQGRDFPAPTFELGMAPAGSLYSTVNDLGRFLSFLFARGRTADGALVKPETLESMWTPQFVKPGTKEGFGIGFHVNQLDGRRRIRHGGAIYGFATELSALPDEKLGVVVIASRDGVNAVTSRIATEALRQLLAVRQKKPLPVIEETKPLTIERARELAGLYRSKDTWFELTQRDGRLHYWSGQGGFRLELRQQGEALVADDRLGYALKLQPDGTRLRLDKEVFEKQSERKPPAVPEKWAGLIGEYGWDYNTLYILERQGKLHALIEWFFLDPLEQESDNVFRFPAEAGLYHGEKLIFTRDKTGRGVSVEAAGIVFERRTLAGEKGTFKITPLRPVEELRKLARAAHPPEERGTTFRKPELVELVKLDDTIKLDVRYATTDNFLSTPFYASARAFLQKPAAEALVRVHRGLKKDGYGLMIFDGYRPWSVTKMFWDATPPQQRIFVANPEQGSRHNRGCAVDLTLYDLATGKAVEMVSGYDEMSDRSYPDYPGGTTLQRYHRELLRRVMEAEGFTVYEAEWWHFDYRDWPKYPIGNQAFEELAR
jgi:serine beta-lactamase-like protein LACTB